MIRQNTRDVLDRDPLVWLSRYRNGLYNRTEFGLAAMIRPRRATSAL